MKYSSFRFVLFFFLTSATFSVVSAQDLLHWQFAEGAHYKVALDLSQARIQEEHNSDPLIDTHGIRFDWLVTSVDQQGNATVLCTFEQLSFARLVGDEELYSFDTDDPTEFKEGSGNQTHAAQLTAMLGQSIELKMSSSGEILDFRVPEDTLAAVLEHDEDFDPTMFEMIIENGWQLLPANEVEIGDTWDASTAVHPIDFEYQVESQHEFVELREIEGQQIAVIEVRHTLAPMEDAVDQIFSQDCLTESLLNLDDGYLLESTTSFEYEEDWDENEIADVKRTLVIHWAIDRAARD